METKSEDKDKDQKKKVKNSSRFKLSEDLKTIRKIKKILCQRGNASDSISGEGKNKEKKIDDRLWTGEYVGDFAIRYIACALNKQAEKVKKRAAERKRKRKIEDKN